MARLGLGGQPWQRTPRKWGRWLRDWHTDGRREGGFKGHRLPLAQVRGQCPQGREGRARAPWGLEEGACLGDLLLATSCHGSAGGSSGKTGSGEEAGNALGRGERRRQWLTGQARGTPTSGFLGRHVLRPDLVSRGKLPSVAGICFLSRLVWTKQSKSEQRSVFAAFKFSACIITRAEAEISPVRAGLGWRELGAVICTLIT